METFMVLANPGSPGKWQLEEREREREREREMNAAFLVTTQPG